MRVDRDAEFVLGTDRRTARDATPFDMRETLWAAGVLVGDVVVCTWINPVRKWRSPNATLACLRYAQHLPARADQRWFCVDRANVRSTPTSLKDRSPSIRTQMPS
jgi:hypothetical protein